MIIRWAFYIKIDTLLIKRIFVYVSYSFASCNLYGTQITQMLSFACKRQYNFSILLCSWLLIFLMCICNLLIECQTINKKEYQFKQTLWFIFLGRRWKLSFLCIFFLIKDRFFHLKWFSLYSIYTRKYRHFRFNLLITIFIFF